MIANGIQAPCSIGGLDDALICRDEREVFAQLIPRPSDAIITLAGGQAGRGYPMDVEDWLAGACAIAGRDLTLDGWTRYLPAGMSTAAATWWIHP